MACWMGVDLSFQPTSEGELLEGVLIRGGVGLLEDLRYMPSLYCISVIPITYLATHILCTVQYI